MDPLNSFLSGGGEMGALIRAFNWSETSIGAAQHWPQALRTSVRTLLNTQHPMIIFWGNDGLCFYNDAFRPSIGSERHPSSLGQPARIVWQEVWSIVGSQIEQVMGGGGGTWHENALVPITRNGVKEEVYWTYSYAPIDDEQAPGGIGGALVLCMETTHQVLAEKRLRQEAERQLRLLQQMPGFVGVLSGPNHVFEYVNDAYVAISGRSEFIGRTVREVFPELEGQGFYELLDNVYATGVPFAARAVPIRLSSDDSGRFIDLLYEPIRNEAGLVTGVFVGGYDATETVRAKAGLEAANATLEQRVAEESRARANVEAALLQAQKMEAVGQLTGGLAHDFNNLLMGISGSLEVLRMRHAQGRVDEMDRFLTAAMGATKRAAALTHRLLAFSRRQTLDPKPTNVNRLVLGMEELIRRTIGPSIELEVVSSSGIWVTKIDQGQLENSLLNLCINARDAMPSGGKVTIETHNRWLDERAAAAQDLPVGQYVSVCVSDTGCGMPPEIAARAFDPFFTTKPIGQGTGLGLSMIYGFARQSGGQVRIYSEVGKGTNVCLYLPRDMGQESNDDERPSGFLPAPESTEATVLVIDDEPTVRMLVAEVLHELGYVALEAGDAVEGLKIVQSETRIDLMVTDVGLPGGMNGRQLAEAAREVRPSLNVLFITGYAENAVLSHGHLEPGMHVLTKPFAMETMASRIQDLVAKAH